MQLQGYHTCFRIDRSNDGRCEEGETLDGDVVEQKDECRAKRDWTEDPEERLLYVDPVEDLCRSNLRYCQLEQVTSAK